MPKARARTDRAWAPEVRILPIRGMGAGALRSFSEERRLGFSDGELLRLRRHFERLGRDPSDVELAGLAQSWSEHCSYKSSKRWLKRAFRGLARSPRVLGTGDAGVMPFGPGLAYALRIESHNHPSAVEPYGGAATGIGGILRDVLAVGARPIALADPLYFGPLEEERPAGSPGLSNRYIAETVIAGIRDYGNRVGVPTVSGSVGFDPAFAGSPLVNVGCVGILPRRRLRPNRAERAGNRVVLVGGLTGRDGLGGVAFASRVLGADAVDDDRGHVQLGNPIMKEPLIRACLEAYDRGLVQGVKDLGGGGLATASGELAYAGGLGLELHLERVPLREAGIRPWEIWTSESQERMLLDVRARAVGALLEIFERFDVPATVLGEFTRGGSETLLYRGRLAAQLEIGFRVDPPLLARPRRPVRPDRRRAEAVPQDDVSGLFEAQVLAPDSVSREPILRLYDHEVQGRTVLKPLHGRPESPSHGDAAVLRPSAGSARGIAVTVAGQPWACRKSPRDGAAATVEEAARNLYAVGARPDALTDCLNFGNPEDPRVLGGFVEALAGLARAARTLGFAIPSGNVSFYNGSRERPIPPTPVLLATGIVEDCGRLVSSDLKRPGDPLYLVGPGDPGLGGSLYERRAGREGGPVPRPVPALTRRAGEALLAAGARGWVRAAHDVSDGGLAVTLFEMAAGGGRGFDVDLAATGLGGPGPALVAEGASRWVVEVDPARAARFERALARLPLARLGEVTEGRGRLAWRGKERALVDLASLYPRWRAGLGR